MTTPKIAMLSREDAKAAAEEVGVPLQLAELNVFRTLLLCPKPAKARVRWHGRGRPSTPSRWRSH